MIYFNKKFICLIILVSIIFSIIPKTSFAQKSSGLASCAGSLVVGAAGGAVVGAAGGAAGSIAGGAGLYVPVFETNPALTTVQTGLQKITSISTANINVQQCLEWAFKLATEALKRQLLNMIVDQIVAFIQGGGTPKFITDWPGFFRDAVDQAGGQFIKQLGLGLFCAPYNLTLHAAFIPIPRFSDRSACTLSQIGVNIDNFLKNFNSGGWVAWDELVLKPQNNIYGAYLLAWDEYENEKSAAAKAAEAEAQAGRGFLSVKKCILSHKNSSGATVCDQYQIVTPGAVVGAAAAEVVGADIKYIVNAQDFAAYVAAISNAILNRIFAEGVGLLHAAVAGGTGGGTSGGGGGSSGRSGGSLTDAQQKCAPFLGTSSYPQCVNAAQSGQDIREFQKNNLTQIIDLDLGFQNQLFGAKQTTLAILNQSFDTLRQLEACQNFPNPNTAAIASSINTATGQIAGIQSDIIALQIKQQQIKAVTDLAQIPSLYAEVAGTVDPAATQSLALAAQEETSQRQTALGVYQQQLDICLQKQAQKQATSTP